MPQKQIKKVELGQSKLVSKLYQSYGLNALRSRGCTPLFALQNSLARSKIGAVSCRPLGGSSATVGRTASDCLPKLQPKKREQKSLSSLLFILLHILDTSSTNSGFAFACSKPIFPPSSSLAINFFFLSHLELSDF